MIAVIATVLVFACPVLVVIAYVEGVRYERRRQARGRGRAIVTTRRPEDLSWGWTPDEDRDGAA